MSYRRIIILFILCCGEINKASCQEKEITDTGYLITKIYKSPELLLVFFISSKSAFSETYTPQSVTKALASEKKVAIAFYLTAEPVWNILSKAFTNNPIRIRNESEVFIMRGGYDSARLKNSLLKYKDDYFHVGLLPAIITYKDISGLPTLSFNNNEREHYEIKSFEQTIMDTYYNPRGKILLDAKIIGHY